MGDKKSEDKGKIDLPYGDGSSKIFGMENFGNTCYCNSILQCLYYSEKFRLQLVNYNFTPHEPKLVMKGVKAHGFTTKYEQIVAKRIREQPKNNSIGGGEDKSKSARKGSIFGIRFNPSNVSANTSISSYDGYKKYSEIVPAKDCKALSIEQRVKISKCPDFQNIPLLVSKPINGVNGTSNATDSSQSSSMLLNNDQPQQTQLEGTVSPSSSIIVVGIPIPESFLVEPISQFSNNPSSDHRKRSALINGPIINLDTSLQLPTQQTEESCLLYALKELFESMIENQSTTGVVSPTYFVSKLKEKNFLFRQTNMHQDAHEFFNYLINEIIECLNIEVGLENNWCNNIFQGMITNETKCLSCETVTSKHEFFLDLSVDIPPGESSFSLNHSLNNFSKSETLTNQNKFYCNTCSSLQEATKSIKLKKLPETLVINFKRFKYDENLDTMVKLFDSVSYPFKLRVFNTTEDETDVTHYELYALVIHIGGGPMHGHYVSLCKTKAGLWLLFDDETVELVEESYVMRFFGDGPGLASAYILFYSKISNSDETEVDNDNDIMNFGFNPNDLYNGNNYSNFIHFKDSTNELNESTPPAREIVKQYEVKPDISSLESTVIQKNNNEISRKPSIFKKTSKIDIKEKEEKDKSILNTTNQVKEKEKKSWVGGLKRRDLKTEATLESKTSSQSTITSSTEKRRSIFGFKRK